MFVRVKSSRAIDPQHEFDVSVAELAANLDLYTVVDESPVVECRPPKYVSPEPVKPDSVKSKK